MTISPCVGFCRPPFEETVVESGFTGKPCFLWCLRVPIHSIWATAASETFINPWDPMFSEELKSYEIGLKVGGDLLHTLSLS